MTRASAAALATTLTAVGCAASTPADESPPLEREVRTLAQELERLHPDLFHAVAKHRFHGEADALARTAPALSRDELVVGLMRLLALLGERDGHTGLFPRDSAHARPLHLYPLRLYAFPSGTHVVATLGHDELVGARLTAVGGVPVERLVEAVAPLVPRDNESSRLGRLPEWLVTAEVLNGLGLTRDERRATFAFDTGATVTLEAVPAPEYSRLGPLHELPAPAGRPRPLWLQRLEHDQLAVTIRGGRVVYVAYRATREAPGLAERMLRLARKPGVRRVILDLRLNGGGDNTSYGALLGALTKPAVSRGGRLVVLIGRATFSAAGNFAADVRARTRARFVGEPTGGAPSQWGDSVPVELPLSGLTVRAATVYHEFGPPGNTRVAVEPDVPVELAADDFFAGRDPVLERAIALR